MGFLEEVASKFLDQLESINHRLEKLEDRAEYNNDVKLYSVDEVAEKLSLGEGKIYDLIRQDKFPYIEVGRRKLVPRRQLVEWIERKGVS